MSNTVNVGFSNDGQSSHYVVENTTLANELGLLPGSVLGSAFISQNVTGGLFADPFEVPGTTVAQGGIVQPDYTTVSTYDEAYRFIASGWNTVKNLTVTASGNDSLLFIADNFVQADIDFSGVLDNVEVRLFDAKRSNILTGEGDDIIRVTSATNNSGWSNLHIIDSGEGNDLVVIGKGDAGLLSNTIVNFVDGRHTTVEANLGSGNDVFTSAENGLKTKDIVHGGTGSDTIFTGAGNDELYGDSDFGSILELTDGFYKLLSQGDTLSGGTGQDKFHYSNGDGFGIVGDGFDHIIDFAAEDVLVLNLLSPLDVVETEIATLQTSAGNLTGTMVLINGDASVFLENYSGTATDIFV